MSAFVLKLIAMATMLLDHMAASCFYHWGIGHIRVELLGNNSLYLIGRMIGRIAFPIFCFLIVEGVHYTKDWKKYGGRLAVLALLSEIPFDFGLHGLQLDRIRQTADFGHQNVFFTLLLGMLAVQFLKGTGRFLYRLRSRDGEIFNGLSGRFLWGLLCILRYALWVTVVLCLGWFAKFRLHSDYGMGGVVMISVMGLIYEPWEDWLPFLPRWVIRVVFCGLGLWACCEILGSSLEYYGMASLIAIGFYNGKKGYSKKSMQYAFYFFYPVHLMALGALAMFT